MDASAWHSLLVSAAGWHGSSTDESLAALLSQRVEYTPPNDVLLAALIKNGMTPLLSDEMMKPLLGVAEGLRREFWNRVQNDILFGSEARLPPEVGKVIEERRATHPEFCKLWRTFESFRVELDDLFPNEHNLVVAQVVKHVFTEIQGLFFPTPGPVRIPMKQRKTVQRAILREYAPSLDADHFIKTSPINAKLAAEQSRLPAVVFLVIAAAIAILVPRDAWWGKILFWIACGMTVLSIASLIPAFGRWIATGRLR